MRIRLIIFAIGFFLFSAISYAEQKEVGFLLDLQGPIGPAASDYIHRGIDKAWDQRAKLVVLRIDTPGGLDTSMREIIKDLLQSPIPVVSYVAPSGARAASAGTYIVYASQIAAMAPGTNLGAATPVQIGGGFPLPKGPGTNDEDGKETKAKGGKSAPTMAEKVINDAVAYIRSLAQMRGRNADWAEKAVREAASLSAEEALKAGVIDLIADDVDDLLAKLDGREVVVLGQTRRLQTSGLALQAMEPDWRTQLLGIITNPNIAYILMLIGIYGLILEFYSPGVLVPGVIGAICLLVALYAFQLLPINYAGFALMLLGLGLMVAEAFAPSFGVLGIGGVIAFVIGSIMLLETDVPGYGISWLLIGATAAVGAGIFIFVLTMLVRSRRRPVVSGPEEMVGSTGQVIDWEGHAGTVRVHGEVWNARAARAIDAGRQVRVEKIDGLTLVVQPQSKRR
ncbi:MAG: nodulation protein NfeD [Alphaproteobacteria bacterium]|nr:nodulation protein NfeD [Alphaproteobacteria bacterium]